ncbi:Zinc finger protein CONSTANS-LIKE 1 [Capsicum baccatum]|uniref:Zinc finger protein CONSTANS-LIKE 1 n=1 Tax=Capsicum baccatum TaxID=33114 RepID=A0A2G2WAH6_CAPBA|nr:Zinc finger protein CONSTANS-LIKE 1 [Capsicum baccatum]
MRNLNKGLATRGICFLMHLKLSLYGKFKEGRSSHKRYTLSHAPKAFAICGIRRRVEPQEVHLPRAPKVFAICGIQRRAAEPQEVYVTVHLKLSLYAEFEEWQSHKRYMSPRSPKAFAICGIRRRTEPQENSKKGGRATRGMHYLVHLKLSLYADMLPQATKLSLYAEFKEGPSHKRYMLSRSPKLSLYAEFEEGPSHKRYMLPRAPNAFIISEFGEGPSHKRYMLPRSPKTFAICGIRRRIEPQEVSSSSLDVGIVPDGSSISEISYPYMKNVNNNVDLPNSTGEKLVGLDREARVLRYREKKKNRKFEKTIRYASRKAYAETRPRIKGRFAKRNDGNGDGARGINCDDIDQIFSDGDFIGHDSRYGIVPSFLIN